MRFLAVVLALVLPAAAAFADVPAAEWTEPDAATLTDVAALQAAARRFPQSAAVRIRLLNVAYAASDAATVRSAMSDLADLGFVIAPPTLEILSAVAGAAETRAIAARMAAGAVPLEASAVFATVPAEHRLVEGVAWDAATGRLYASSVVGRALLVMDGEWRPVAGVEAGSLFGLTVDAPRRRLWMASGVLDPTPQPESAFRGLIALDLDSQRVVRRIAAPDGVSLADIAVAPDGTVYASDPVGGGLYRLSPGAGRIETLVAPGRLRGPQGIAVTADGRRLYVADYGYGIAIVDPASGAVARLASDRPMMLDGVDGLFLADGALVAIQNGTRPLRIVRIRLDAEGLRATGLEVIEQAHRQWGEPTLGQLRDGDLIYVADAQWERFGPGGAIVGDEPLRATAIRIVPLREGGEPPPG
jgi:hypothetical protein